MGADSETIRWLTQAGAVAYLLVSLWALVRGYVWTKGSVDRVLDEKDKQIAAERERTHEVAKDRDWWREVAVRATNIGEAAVRRNDKKS